MGGSKVAYLIVAIKQKRRQDVKRDFKSLNICQSLSRKTWCNTGMKVMGVTNCFLIGFESY